MPAARMDLRPVAEPGGRRTVTDAPRGAPGPPIGRNLVLTRPANLFRVVTLVPDG